MLDPKFIGLESEVAQVFEVEKGAIRKFADAIGDPNPVYRDEKAAREAGYSAIPAPPTFPITFQFDMKDGVRGQLKIDMRKVLHGEQEFTYRRPLVAGDKVFLKQKIADIYSKSGKTGGMDFLVIDTIAADEKGVEVFRMRGVTVVRH